MLPALAVAQAVVEAQAVVAPPVIDARLQQYIQLLQPALWRELDFVRQVCPDIPLDQRPKIKAGADAAVRKAADAMTKPQRAPATAMANKLIRDGVREILKSTLSEDLFAKFTAEDDLRDEAMKKAAIKGLVSQLDGALYLNQQQRQKIMDGLELNWQPDWEHWLTMQQHQAQYFPQVPDQHVVPHLNAEQKLVWDGLQKVMIGYWSSNGRRQADDNWWSGQPPPATKANTAKAKAAAKK